MSQSNPVIGDIVRINDSSVGSKHGKTGTIVRVPNAGSPLEGTNRFKVELDGGDSYVTRYAHDLEFTGGSAPASPSRGGSEGGAATIPAPKPVKATATVTEVIGNTIDENKANAILVARTEAGKLILLQAKDRIKPMLPPVVAEHTDNPMFSLALANLIAFSQKQFLPGNKKAAVVADCVLKSAMLEAGSSLQLPEKINDIINGALGSLDFAALGLAPEAPAGKAATPTK